MTIARGTVFNREERGYYHCFSRCVRRAFLCGFDKLTGKSFAHRRQWIRERLAFLVEIFAIELIGYAVMDNHAHTLVENRPDLAKVWSPAEVARRWRLLFPYRREEDGTPSPPNENEIQMITSRPELVEKLRERLSCISWFHRCLNEHIAKLANAEDDCTGRFWEGRFRSERLETTAAVLACSVYVDLNPIRSGLAETPEESDFTSIQSRLQSLRNEPPLCPMPKLVPMEDLTAGEVTEEHYATIVDETGRMVKEGKSAIPDHLAPVLERLRLKPEGWLELSTNKHRLFRRVIGPVSALRDAAQRMGKQWLHGISSARRVFAA